MKVRIYIEKTAALRAGLEGYGPTNVDVPAAALTQEQRDELARYSTLSSDEEKYGAAFSLTRDFHETDFPEITEATQEAVIRILDYRIARRKAQQENDKIERDTAVRKWLAKPLADCINYDGTLDYRFARLADDPRLADKKRDALVHGELLAAERKAAQEREEAERRQREAERVRRREECEAKLAAWARDHGSELLKERLAGHFDWEKLAENEFADAVAAQVQGELVPDDETPEGYVHDETTDRTTPTLEEIRSLKAVRARLGDLPAVARLVWIKYKPQEDEYGYPGDAEPYGETNLALTVTCPNGAERVRYFKIPAA